VAERSHHQNPNYPLETNLSTLWVDRNGLGQLRFVEVWLLVASIVHGLLVTTFLILLVAATAVVGSMLVLALFDLVVNRKPPSDVTTGMLDAKRARISTLKRQ
jgi:hypothetical protein